MNEWVFRKGYEYKIVNFENSNLITFLLLFTPFGINYKVITREFVDLINNEGIIRRIYIRGSK